MMHSRNFLFFAPGFFLVFFSLLVLTSCSKSKDASSLDDGIDLSKLEVPMSKFDQVRYLLQLGYVDELPTDSMEDIAIAEMVRQLDPHSCYIPAKDLEDVNSELSDSFYGIGVQFSIQDDTVNVITVIRGGPSEKVGLLPGDKIVSVDDSSFVGKTITNERVLHTLRGEKDTEVRLGVRRSGTKDLLHYTIRRGEVPVKSVDAAYIVDGTHIGYLCVNKFGEGTYDEYIAALANLRRQGAKSYIIDLRQNSGGYMEQAIQMANEWLAKDQMIVYAEGRAYPRYEAKAQGNGRFLTEPLVVLIDGFSASASEIFAGAMQDNHRATIIGQRSFGKGLVQQQIPLPDGSALRMTVARYYTPSGRCVQKPYKLGDQDDYDQDLIDRYEHGEMFHADSIHADGGIIPDIFVPRDTSYSTPYANTLINLAYTYQFAFRYVSEHRAELSRYKDWKSLELYLRQQDLMAQLSAFAATKGVKPVPAQIAKSKQQLLRLVRAYIVRDMLGDEAFFPLYMRDDEVMHRAVQKLR